jgi:hypothetical protein
MFIEENFKKDSLKNSYNFKENTTSPIGKVDIKIIKRKDKIEDNNIFTKIPSNLIRNSNESNNKISSENDNVNYNN